MSFQVDEMSDFWSCLGFSPTGPQIVDDFTIVKPIARGGFGWIAEAQNSQGQAVVVKCLKSFETESDRSSARARFGREIEIYRNNVGRTESGYWPHYYSDGLLPNGMPYLAIEFIRGVTWSQLTVNLNRSAMTDLGLFLEPIFGLIEAVKSLHRLQIVHRDLSASNVLIDMAGRVRILDFGLALVSDGRDLTPNTSIVHGTKWIADPGIYRNITHDVTSDIFSIGCLAIKLWSGRYPGDEDPDCHKPNEHLNTTNRPWFPDENNVDTIPVPQSVRRVFRKMLTTKRDDRFRNLQDVDDALRLAIRNPDLLRDGPSTLEWVTVESTRFPKLPLPEFLPQLLGIDPLQLTQTSSPFSSYLGIADCGARFLLLKLCLAILRRNREKIDSWRAEELSEHWGDTVDRADEILKICLGRFDIELEAIHHVAIHSDDVRELLSGTKNELMSFRRNVFSIFQNGDSSPVNEQLQKLRQIAELTNQYVQNLDQTLHILQNRMETVHQFLVVQSDDFQFDA